MKIIKIIYIYIYIIYIFIYVYCLGMCRATLIKQLKDAQHNLMTVIMCIADQAIPDHRASRDFRAKYPDDVILEQINGELLLNTPS